MTFSDETFWVAQPRDVLMIEGADALTYLQSQVSQDLRPLAVGSSVYTLVLQPTGKVDAVARVLRSGEHAFIIDVDAGAGEAVAARLARFKIRVAAEITTVAWECIAVRGPQAHEIRPGGGAVAVPAWWGDGRAIDVLGPSVKAPQGVRAGTLDELESARVAAGWPQYGAEITEATLPAELGVVPVAVSFTKGCYPGQELVERMDSRGARSPRMLRRVPVSPGAQPGDAVMVDGVDVGRLTSVAGQQALALVKRDVEFGEVAAPPA
jgi:tRNA-modifying protein YgfZ